MLNILTTQKKFDHPIWKERTELLPGYWEYFESSHYKHWNKTLLKDLYWGIKLFMISKKYKAVVTGSERLSLIFALMQCFRKKRVPHIFIQSMWNFPINTSAKRWKLLLWRLVTHSAFKVLVFDRRQIKIYSKALKAQENKFQFIYSHTSIYGKSYMRSDGNYVFSGGNTNRDYETLIEASRELPYQFLIVTTEADQLLNRLDIPKNVTLKCRISEDEFNQLIAKASVVVVPLKGGLIESGGRLVYLNAMTLGKPVVVADDNGALDYIRNGTDGFVVKSGDIAELRKSIDLLMRNRKLASVIGNNAEKSAVAFSPEAFFKEIFAFVDNIHLP